MAGVGGHGREAFLHPEGHVAIVEDPGVAANAGTQQATVPGERQPQLEADIALDRAFDAAQGHRHRLGLVAPDAAELPGRGRPHRRRLLDDDGAALLPLKCLAIHGARRSQRQRHAEHQNFSPAVKEMSRGTGLVDCGS